MDDFQKGVMIALISSLGAAVGTYIWLSDIERRLKKHNI